MINTKGLTHQQIKSACNWDKAQFIKDPKANKMKILELKGDTKSDPKPLPNCSFWNNDNLN